MTIPISRSKPSIYHSILVAFILMVIASSAQAAKQSWPQPTAFVSDYANVLADSEEAQINQIATALDKKIQAQLAVVTITNLKERGYATVEEAAVDLFAQWGIGHKGKDEGLLILVSVNDRKWRIEVGYGLEGIIPDAIASRVGRTLLPDAFRAGRYGQGLLDLSTALVAEIARQKNIPLSEFNINAASVPRNTNPRNQNAKQSSPLAGVLPLLMGIIMFIFFVRNPKLFLLYLLMGGGSHRSSNHWGGGSHFGGGGSFGGFGGGSSGGGGASGGW